MSEPPSETTATQATNAAARVASSVMRVSDLDRSVRFYRDVFHCHVALREPHAALLLAPDGFQIYLNSKGQTRRHGVGPGGVQYLMWATDSEAELDRIRQRLLAYDPATYTHVENGVTFVEGCEPDHRRVIVAYPGPNLLRRELIASRFRGHYSRLHPCHELTLRRRQSDSVSGQQSSQTQHELGAYSVCSASQSLLDGHDMST